MSDAELIARLEQEYTAFLDWKRVVELVRYYDEHKADIEKSAKVQPIHSDIEDIKDSPFPYSEPWAMFFERVPKLPSDPSRPSWMLCNKAIYDTKEPNNRMMLFYISKDKLKQLTGERNDRRN